MSNVCRKKWYGNWVLYSGLKMSRHQIFSRGKCCSTGCYLDAASCTGPSSLVPTFPRETAQPGGPHVTSSLCAWPDWDRADRDHASQSAVVVFACTGRKIVVASRLCCRYRRSVSHKTKTKFIRIQFFPEENNIVLSNKWTSINGIICVINTSAISQNMFKIDSFNNWV
jgi:hypothetical protein